MKKFLFILLVISNQLLGYYNPEDTLETAIKNSNLSEIEFLTGAKAFNLSSSNKERYLAIAQQIVQQAKLNLSPFNKGAQTDHIGIFRLLFGYGLFFLGLKNIIDSNKSGHIFECSSGSILILFGCNHIWKAILNHDPKQIYDNARIIESIIKDLPTK